MRGGINRAVPAKMFDQHFEVLCTWLVEVTQYWGYNVYGLRIRQSSCDFELDGRILWDSKKEISIRRQSLLRGVSIVEGEVNGWRVPR